MATYTVTSGSVGTGLVTLTAATVDTVNFAEDLNGVELVHVSGTDVVWYTLDGSAPTVGGANSYILPPGGVDQRGHGEGASTTVKLISSGTPTVRVQRAT